MFYLKKEIMDFLFNQKPYYPSAEIYMGLLTISGEPIAEDYKRLNVTGLWSRSENGLVYNVKELPHWEPHNFWGDCVSVGIYDGNSKTSNMLFSSTLRTKFSAIPNQRIVFPEKSVQYKFLGAADYSDRILDAVFNKEVIEPPCSLYLALHTADGEVSDPEYRRLNIADAFEEATEEGIVVNARPLAFPIPSSNWGLITSAIVFDSEVDGKTVMRVDLRKPISITRNQNLILNAGVLQFNFVVRG